MHQCSDGIDNSILLIVQSVVRTGIEQSIALNLLEQLLTLTWPYVQTSIIQEVKTVEVQTSLVHKGSISVIFM